MREILKKGNLTAKEIKGELWGKNVSFVRLYDRPCTGLWIVLVVLWLLPVIAKWSDWGFLNFFAQLPRVDFPYNEFEETFAGGEFVVVAYESDNPFNESEMTYLSHLSQELEKVPFKNERRQA